MHLLFRAIGWLIALFYEFKVARLGVNTAIIFAYIAVIISMTLTFFTALDFLISSLSYIIPTQFLELVGPYFPDNFQACFSVILSARILKMSLVWSLRLKTMWTETALRT